MLSLRLLRPAKKGLILVLNILKSSLISPIVNIPSIRTQKLNLARPFQEGETNNLGC